MTNPTPTTPTTRKKPNLLLLIVIAIALGVVGGLILPDWIMRIFSTFSAIFSSFLGFFIPLLILGFVAPAIAEIGNRAGSMLVANVAISYAMTFGTGELAYCVSVNVFPHLLSGASAVVPDTSAAMAPQPYFNIPMEAPITVMGALVLAFVLGFGCAVLPDRTATLRAGIEDFRAIIQLVIMRFIIPLLPLYIYGIFQNMTAEGTVAPILMTFVKIIAVIFVMHIGVLILQYCIASIFSQKNPFKCLKTMLPAYMTALGTQSSAATIPVTLERTIKMGVPANIAGFVIPLCATIHMSGSTLKIVSCAVALMIVRDIPFDASMFAAFIAMLGITIVAAPGVPGGAIMASLGVLSSILGFTEADNAMMIALYIAMDSFGTACNITGDGAIAQIIARIFPNKNPQPATA